MENKSHAFIAGLFTVCLVAAALFIVWFLNMDRTVRVPYMIATNQSIPGLNPQATVRFRGLDVGRVTRIGFNPEEPGEILIYFEVKDDTPMTKSTFATLTYQGVTGIASVELSDDGTNMEKLVTSPENPAEIPMRPSLLAELQLRGLQILKEVQSVSSQLAILFNDKNSKTMMDAFRNISRTAESWEKVPHQLEPTLHQLPQVTEDTRKMIQSITELSKDLKDLSQKANTFMSNDMSSDAIPRLESLTEDAKMTLYNLNKVLEQYKQRPSGLLFGAKGPAPGPGEPGFDPDGQ
ncbi:MlaD family protein [Oxalobacter aliiformigenes]|uniref:MlaD family protein n=1 Tax=Oxalobacter aliiformigenes TaxID=2946593 RepID=UPI0022AEB4C9|nr:MlaD family protein [Oxalobacter aliiformigenes]WAV89433.1 MlaD family protein [Oxalobacter aliiformigenes]